MVNRATTSGRLSISLLLLAAIVAAGCMPAAGTASPTPVAPTEATRTAQPIPSDDGVTAGEAPRASASTEASSSPVPATSAAPSEAPVVASADPEPFAMNLYRKGDFVTQYTFEWCVGASLQMALNMATKDSRTSRADQQSLWEMARDRSFSPFGGANPRGWTATLNELGIGPYQLVSLASFDDALGVAAKALRATRRPVGLVMWRGRHAWVMSGFEATADPRTFDDFDVTGIRVLDPLYPHGSSVWGKSPAPNSLVSPATLAKQYVLRDSTRVNLGVPPGYLLILPVAAA